MGFFKNLEVAWKQSQAEKKWQKSLKRSVSSALIEEKSAMTAKGEPWVGIIKMDIDPTDVASGSVELDWNDIFVARLVKAGYNGRNDKEIVDQWFKSICAGVIEETYENDMADPDKRKSIQRKSIGKDRYEVG